LRGGAAGNFFGKVEQVGAREIAKEPVTGDAAFGEGEESNAALGGLRGEALDLGKIRGFVAGRVFKLGDGCAECGHGRSISVI
jgi:hypothetical protein